MPKNESQKWGWYLYNQNQHLSHIWYLILMTRCIDLCRPKLQIIPTNWCFTLFVTPNFCFKNLNLSLLYPYDAQTPNKKHESVTFVPFWCPNSQQKIMNLSFLYPYDALLLAKNHAQLTFLTDIRHTAVSNTPLGELESLHEKWKGAFHFTQWFTTSFLKKIKEKYILRWWNTDFWHFFWLSPKFFDWF